MRRKLISTPSSNVVGGLDTSQNSENMPKKSSQNESPAPSLTDDRSETSSNMVFRTKMQKAKAPSKAIDEKVLIAFLGAIEETLKAEFKTSIGKIIKNKIAFKNITEFIEDKPATAANGAERKVSESSSLQKEGSQKRKLVSLSESQNEMNQNKKGETSQENLKSDEDEDRLISHGKLRLRGISQQGVETDEANADEEPQQRRRRGAGKLRKSTTLVMSQQIPLLGMKSQVIREEGGDDGLIEEEANKRKRRGEQNLSNSYVIGDSEARRLGKRSTMLVGGNEGKSPLGHKRNPSTSHMDKSGQDDEYLFASQVLPNNASPSRSLADTGFRVGSEGNTADGEFKARLANMQTLLISLLRKKLKTSFYSILLTSMRLKDDESKKLDQIIYTNRSHRTSTKEDAVRLNPSNPESPLLRQNTPALESILTHGRTDSNRESVRDSVRNERDRLIKNSQAFNKDNPSENKNIEYNKIITTARLFIKSQEFYNSLKSRTLHMLIKHKDSVLSKGLMKIARAKKLVSCGCNR